MIEKSILTFNKNLELLLSNFIVNFNDLQNVIEAHYSLPLSGDQYLQSFIKHNKMISNSQVTR